MSNMRRLRLEMVVLANLLLLGELPLRRLQSLCGIGIYQRPGAVDVLH
jgi:hypothetical protein